MTTDNECMGCRVDRNLPLIIEGLTELIEAQATEMDLLQDRVAKLEERPYPTDIAAETELLREKRAMEYRHAQRGH